MSCILRVHKSLAIVLYIHTFYFFSIISSISHIACFHINSTAFSMQWQLFGLHLEFYSSTFKFHAKIIDFALKNVLALLLAPQFNEYLHYIVIEYKNILNYNDSKWFNNSRIVTELLEVTMHINKCVIRKILTKKENTFYLLETSLCGLSINTVHHSLRLPPLQSCNS